LKDDKIKVEGKVIKITPNSFQVELDNKHIVTATVSGKMRVNSIYLLVGDRVIVELSLYDLTKGRIIRRL